MDISVLITGKPIQAWVPFTNDSEVLIEYAPREELLRLNEQAKTIQYRNGQKTEVFDAALADKLLARRVVKDWKGFTSGGAEFPCTPENIECLMTKWNEFARLVNETCVNLESLSRKEKDSTIKNS